MAADFDKKISRKIAKLREQAGLSQQELADKLGVDRVTISQIECGERKITAAEIAKLARIFNTTSDILLDLQQDIEVRLEKPVGTSKKTPAAVRINVPVKNVSKFKEVLLYILSKVGSKPNVGESVLYKLLYFTDFDYYEKYEEQLIGATYIKNHYGPTPKEFAKIVEQMKDRDLVQVQTKYFRYPQRKYLPLRKPDLTKLSARELATIDRVLDRLSDMNSEQISDYSHYDVPWLTTEDGKVIDYESVFYRTPGYSVRSYDDKDIQ
jgi:addiction module HigA family antidote